ncbi:Cyclic AMP-regulated protein [Operophtera brumata]|uniref:Cyclic AMP-regulated protein n=1 Tax=Operophtera brumata TaxID=104452 RepID=A0A0L7L9Y3_OPEBR|nr:Cyclic AMP-regulated protein [Operophtera brumata]
MDNASTIEGSYLTLQATVNKLTENQCSLIAQFDFLTKNLEELRKIMAQFSVKLVDVEDLATDRKRLKAEIKILKSRIDELYGIVKEGKEEKEDSSRSDVQDVESCHSGLSNSSKVAMTTGIDRDTIRSAYDDKFLFVTWVGPNVSVINRAKMSTDKAIIKEVISNFAVELQLENQSEIDIDQFKDALNRAGGANYGTGIRE